MAWIGVIVDVLLKVLKGLFGYDKPTTTEVVNEKPDKPVDPSSDADRLRELGVRTDDRSKGGD